MSSVIQIQVSPLHEREFIRIDHVLGMKHYISSGESKVYLLGESNPERWVNREQTSAIARALLSHGFKTVGKCDNGAGNVIVNPDRLIELVDQGNASTKLVMEGGCRFFVTSAPSDVLKVLDEGLGSKLPGWSLL